MKYKSNMFTNTLKENSNVSSLNCGVFLTKYFYFSKPHLRKMIRCWKFYTIKNNSKRICFPASLQVLSPPPLPILEPVCRSWWTLKLLYNGLKMLQILKNFLFFYIVEPKFMRCSKKKNPKVKSVFNDRRITENFPHKVLML